MKKAEKFEDKSIFRYGLTYVQQHEQLNQFFQEQQREGSIIGFPSKEF